jgi:crossover junction endodeoxyribonuclease RuvC
METVLGIDPGSRVTGYGIVAYTKGTLHYVTSGYIQVFDLSMPQRLSRIYAELSAVMQQYRPRSAAIEKIFMHENPGSALKLGQARGVAIVATGLDDIAEYSATQVKQAVVGYGNASKLQVQAMIQILLNPQKKLQADEADALAVAICHTHSCAYTSKVVEI